MKRSCGRLRYLWLLLAMPLAASTVRIYVTSAAGDNVYVIDPLTNKVVQVIEDIEAPHGITFSPDGARVYVSNESEDVLDVVDRKTGKIIKKVPLSGRPNTIAVTKDGGRVFVAIREDPGALDVIDTTSLKRVKSIPTKGGLHNGYVTPDGKYAVVGAPETKFVIVIDLQTEQPVWDVQFDHGIRTMAIESGPDGSTSRIFVNLGRLNGFAVVDFATHEEVARIKFPDTPSGGNFDPATPSHGIGVAPDGKTLWINSAQAKCVFVYSLPDLKLVGHALTGDGPDWLTFAPDSKMIYVSNSMENSVSVIDTMTLKEVARVPVGEVPKRSKTLVLQ